MHALLLRIQSIIGKLLSLFNMHINRLPRLRDKYFITDLVSAHLHSVQSKFVVVEGGARESFSTKRWKGISTDSLTVYGFEVDKEECERLNSAATRLGLDYHFYPFGLWSEKTQLPFYVLKERGGSSFYLPNNRLINRWSYQGGRNFTEMHSIEKKIQVDVTTLEQWGNEVSPPDIDFMKLNVQGAELEILKGCGSRLDNVLGLELEMSFSQTYLDAPLFSEVDTFVRGKGFHFFDCTGANVAGRINCPVSVFPPEPLYMFQRPCRQFFEGHFLYLRDPIEMARSGKRANPFHALQLLKLAAFAEMFGQVEYAFELLHWLIQQLKEQGNIRDAETLSSLIYDEAISQYSKFLGKASFVFKLKSSGSGARSADES